MDSRIGVRARSENHARLWERVRLSFMTAMDSKKNEVEQAWIRVVMASILVPYTSGLVGYGLLDRTPQVRLFSITVPYFLMTVSVLVWLKMSPQPKVWRRIFLIFADIVALSASMQFCGRYGAGWYPVYLWISFGNGMRFGVPYLLLSSVVSLIGFLYVVLSTPFWQKNPEVGVGLMAGLLILPYYVSRLLVRLQNAINEAKRANTGKSRFLASMSHEIRTPLNGVIATTDVLGSMSLPTEATRLIRTVQTSSQAVLSMINDILDIGKIEMGRMPVESAIFSLREVLIEVREIVGAVARRKGIALTLFCACDVPDQLEGDPGHVRQVLLNIVGNAVKFTTEGQVSVRVSRDGEDTGRVTVAFDIEDSGIGIAENKSACVFEPFMQASLRSEGTGLGVTIARELTELMGGRIYYDSEVGVGTTFYIRIPFEVHEDRFDTMIADHPQIVCVGINHETRQALCDGMDVLGIRVSDVRDAEGASDLTNCVRDDRRDVVIFIDAHISDLGGLRQRIEKSMGGIRSVWLIACASTHRQASYLIGAGVTAILWHGAIDKVTIARALGTCIRVQPGPVPATHLPAPIESLRVLIADGRKINRDIMRMALAELHAEVRMVETGEQMLGALEEEAFDVIIVEMNLPDMSGTEAIQVYTMANLDQKDRSRFLLVTADATVETRNELAERGVHNVLTKPFRAGDLVERVRQLVTETRIRQAIPGADMANDGNLLNVQTLERLRLRANGDMVFLLGVYRSYVSDTNALLTQMRAAVRSARIDDFLGCVRTLRDTSSYIGAEDVERRCVDFLHMTDNIFSAHGIAQLEKLTYACEIVKEPLQRALQLVQMHEVDTVRRETVEDQPPPQIALPRAGNEDAHG